MDEQTKGPVQQQPSSPAEQERPDNLYSSLLSSRKIRNQKTSRFPFAEIPEKKQAATKRAPLGE
jgi:hypothetical protein